MINEIKQDAQERMSKSIDSLKSNLNKVRTGRAHRSLLDNIVVEYYGMDTPLNQVGNISTPDARTLAITVFDKGMIGAVEKAILKSDLGLNPSSQGTLIRIPLPPLTEERRKELAKQSKSEADHAKVGIRNARQEANKEVKNLDISDDAKKNAEIDIQALTDSYVKKIDEIYTVKEKEIMTV